MTEIEARISDARTRLTMLQQASRSGAPRHQVLFALLTLAAELAGFVFEKSAEAVQQKH